jgi:hypothetical protein
VQTTTQCEYCNETVHHEYDRVVDEYDMCYHVWCYERIQGDDYEQVYTIVRSDRSSSTTV